MLGNLSIRWKLALYILVFCGLFISVFGYLSYALGRTSLIEATSSDLQSAVYEKEKALEFWRYNRLETLNSLSQSHEVINDINKLSVGNLPVSSSESIFNHLDIHFSPWLGQANVFESVLLLDPVTGQVIYATDKKEIGTLKENRDYYVNGLVGPTTFGPYYSVTKGAASIAASSPVYSHSGEILAVMVARLNMANIDEIMQRRNGVNETFDAYLVNTARLFVSQPRELTDSAILRRGLFLPYLDHCITDKSNGWTIDTDYRGTPVIVAYRWSPELQLCVLAKLDQSEAFQATESFGWIALVVNTLMFSAIGLVTLYIARWVTKPIMLLHRAAESIISGNLTVRVREPTGNDEIGDLMLRFNDMAESLESKERQIVDYTNNLEQKVKERTQELRAAQDKLVKSERLATLGQLSATVSHELRNPLGTISNSWHILHSKLKASSSDIQRTLDMMRRNIDRCDNIIDEMLDYARDTAPELKPTVIDTWLNDLIIEGIIPAGLKVKTKFSAGEINAWIDADMFRRALINLINNARDAMLENAAEKNTTAQGAELIISTRCEENSVKIELEDNGPGIPADTLESIFEPLFSTKSFGVGLGLSVVKKIVEKHEGSIEIKSVVGKGTRATISLPLKMKPMLI